MTKKDEHYTERDARLAAETPQWARPYCWTHRKSMEWHGVWACADCNPWLRQPVFMNPEATR